MDGPLKIKLVLNGEDILISILKTKKLLTLLQKKEFHMIFLGIHKVWVVHFVFRFKMGNIQSVLQDWLMVFVFER